MDDIDRAQDYADQHRAHALAAHHARRPPPAPSAVECHECGEPIPIQRRRLAPGCTRCRDCQEELELQK